MKWQNERRRKKTGGRKEGGEKPEVRKCGGIMIKWFKSRRREGGKGWRRGRRGRHAAGRTQTRVTSRFVATETFILNQTEMFFWHLSTWNWAKLIRNRQVETFLRFCRNIRSCDTLALWFPLRPAALQTPRGIKHLTWNKLHLALFPPPKTNLPSDRCSSRLSAPHRGSSPTTTQRGTPAESEHRRSNKNTIHWMTC